MIPAYIEARVRRSSPEGACVVPGSTPVLAFGDARTAYVATLGLNPSASEFINRAGVLLEGNERRLATHASLGFSDLATAPSHVISQVIDDCNRYFQRKPYRRWFDRLKPILVACNASYYDGSACHLDLVQWATNPKWGDLPTPIRNQLIADDVAFLAGQLQNENIRILLVNGSGVWNVLRRMTQKELSVEHEEVIDGHSAQECSLISGRLFEKICVVAWSANIQSSRGVKASLLDEIARRAAHLCA